MRIVNLESLGKENMSTKVVVSIKWFSYYLLARVAEWYGMGKVNPIQQRRMGR
jgi:hypothetical protein